MVFSFYKRCMRVISWMVFLSFSTCSFAGFWDGVFNNLPALSVLGIAEAMRRDSRLALSGVFIAGTVGILGYALYDKIKTPKRYLPHPTPDTVDSSNFNTDFVDAPLEALQLLVIRNNAQRILDLQDKPCVDARTSKFVNKNHTVPLILENGARVWQPRVLWQPMTRDGFTKRDFTLDKARAQAGGVNVRQIQHQLPEVTLGNGILFQQYIRNAQDGREYKDSIAGGPASCAYQALKNSICLLNALYAGEDANQYNSSLDTMLDIPYAIHLFGTHGIWREKVIEHLRKPQLMRWYLDEQLSYKKFLIDEEELNALTLDNGIRPKRLLSIYQSIATELNQRQLARKLDHIFQELNPSQRVILKHTVQDLIDVIKNTSARHQSEETDKVDINEFMKTDEALALCIKKDVAELSCEVHVTDAFFREQLKNHEKYRENLRKTRGYCPEPITLDGENLIDSELQELIKLEKQTGGLLYDFNHIPFDTVQDDIILDKTIIPAIKNELKKNASCRVLLLHGDGHWISFIISKVNGTLDYIIADSLNFPRYGAAYVEAADEAYGNALNYSELTLRIWKIIDAIGA